MSPTIRRVSVLIVFLVASVLSTLMWAGKNGHAGFITWEDAVYGCVSALIVAAILHVILKYSVFGLAPLTPSVERPVADEPPPFLRTWSRVYLAVICYLAVLIALFYCFGRSFSV
jgi:hypothetical protein